MYGIYILFFFSLRSYLPVWWWACPRRSDCCRMSVVGQIVAEGTHSPELLPQWELDPHRGTQDLQTPEWEAAEGGHIISSYLYLNEEPS